MTEPVTAADVMWAALCGFEELSPEEYIDALREACGGGDIVIRADGSLSALRMDAVSDTGHLLEMHNVGDGGPLPTDVPLYAVVPVERGA